MAIVIVEPEYQLELVVGVHKDHKDHRGHKDQLGLRDHRDHEGLVILGQLVHLVILVPRLLMQP